MPVRFGGQFLDNPHEMLIIGGAAVAATITGNSMHELKLLGGGLGKVFKGPKYNDQDHIDAIALTSRLMRMMKTEGPVALEAHVTDPGNSAIFAEYPKLAGDKAICGLICDRMPPRSVAHVGSDSIPNRADRS